MSTPKILSNEEFCQRFSQDTQECMTALDKIASLGQSAQLSEQRLLWLAENFDKAATHHAERCSELINESLEQARFKHELYLALEPLLQQEAEIQQDTQKLTEFYQQCREIYAEAYNQQASFSTEDPSEVSFSTEASPTEVPLSEVGVRLVMKEAGEYYCPEDYALFEQGRIPLSEFEHRFSAVIMDLLLRNTAQQQSLQKQIRQRQSLLELQNQLCVKTDTLCDVHKEHAQTADNYAQWFRQPIVLIQKS
jgi:hypothetical protein